MIEKNFIKTNVKRWRIFESTLIKLTSKGFANFDENELENFIIDYNIICGHLSYSRTNYKDSDTTIFLNNLVATAHGFIYSRKKTNSSSLGIFFLKDFPILLCQSKNYFYTSAILFLMGIIFSFLITLINPDNSIAFIPEQYTNIDFTKNKVSITLANSAFASSILTNNIKIGLFAFSLGLTFGIGTVIILIKNAFLLGSLSALAFKEHLTMQFWSLVLPHGLLEIFAILVCSSAGLVIGYSLINPGEYSRKTSLLLKGKQGVKLLLGTIPIFTIAGIIEAFITPNSWSNYAKIGFAIFTLFLLIIYYLIPNFKNHN